MRAGLRLCGTKSRFPLVGSTVLSLHMTGSDSPRRGRRQASERIVAKQEKGSQVPPLIH